MELPSTVRNANPQKFTQMDDLYMNADIKELSQSEELHTNL